MKILIVGAGRVGRKVARALSPIHEVTVLDVSREVVNLLNFEMDVIAVEGDGTSVEDLKRAGVQKADYVIATTSNDNSNMIICGLAKGLGAAFTIARVKRIEYLSLMSKGAKILGIDRMICSTPLVARSIVNVLEYPHLRIFTHLYGPLYVGDALARPEKVWSTEICGRIIVVGTKKEFERELPKRRPSRVVILGASEVGLLMARSLERKYLVKLVEINGEKALKASRELDNAIVFLHDAFDVDFWEREGLKGADIVIAAMERDEKNLFGALLAKHLGAQRSFAIIRDERYLPMFEENGIIALSPQDITAERILITTQGKNILGVVSAIPGVQVLAVKGRAVIEKSIPGVIGPVVRDEKIINFPKEIREDDVVTLIVPENRLGELEL